MRDEMVTAGLPRPGKALLSVMGVLLSIWVVLAILVNYGHVEEGFLLFAGNTKAILAGEVWRFFTAGLVNDPVGGHGVSHILTVLLGLYFLGPTLEARWGPRRTVMFLIGAVLTGFACQFVVEAISPRAVSSALGQPYWFGSMATVEAIAIAWALSNRGQTVRLYFVLPVSSNGLLIFVIGISVLYVIGGAKPAEGLVTPFGGMLAGYLFGAGNPTPARRALLKLRYRWIARRAGKARGAQPRLRVIEGGETPEPRRKPPTDKRFLN
jgi:membrane associated rhomboid family serine protease